LEREDGRLEAKVVWGEIDIRSIVTHVSRVRPDVTAGPKDNHVSAPLHT